MLWIWARGGTPRKEVGTMGYLVIGIAYIVLTVVAVVKPRTAHA
jgi:hypothetical protein